MPVNNKTLIVYDFETGSPDPHTCEPIQIAAVAINPRNLTIIPGSQFSSYIKPRNWNNIEEQAMAVNKIDLNTLQRDDTPSLENVFSDFINYVNKYNNKNSVYQAPIPCGYNIINFDNIIIDRLSKEFKLLKAWDEERKRNKIFSQVICYDVLQVVWSLFENIDENTGPENLKLISILKWAGIPTDGAHNAIIDVERTAQLIIKLLKMNRYITPRIKKVNNAQNIEI